MAIAKFEKVSLEAWLKAFQDGNDAKMTDDDKAKLTEFWENIRLPERATKGSAGYDFFTPIPIGPLTPFMSQCIPTGIKCKMDDGWVLVMVPKSRYHEWRLGLDYTVGVIDSDYYNNPQTEGQMFIYLNNGLPPSPPKINPITNKLEMNKADIFGCREGTPIVQGIFLPYGVAEEVEPTSIRTGGFGSTGNVDTPKSPIIT